MAANSLNALSSNSLTCLVAAIIFFFEKTLELDTPTGLPPDGAIALGFSVGAGFSGYSSNKFIEFTKGM